MNIKELVKRLLVAAVAIPLVCFCVFYPIFMNIVTTTLSYVGVQEWVLLRAAMLNHLDKKPDREISIPQKPNSFDAHVQVHLRSLLASTLPLIAYVFYDNVFYLLAALISLFGIMFTGTIFGIMHSNTTNVSKKAVYDLIALAVDYFGVIYVSLQLSCAILLLRTTPILLLTILFSNWAADAAALAFGKKLGRHKLCPSLSPNKTVEGAVGALIGSVAFSLIIRFISVQFKIFDPKTIASNTTFIYTGVLLGVLGVIGDLLESFYKRVTFVKDSGNFFGAHGGVLDRIDGLLFSFPIMYIVDQLGYFSVLPK
jgi:CDP-diglyceride synthetase